MEIAQAYHRPGTKVKVLQRSPFVLSKLTPDVSDELLKHLRREGVNIQTGLTFTSGTEEKTEIRETKSSLNGFLKGAVLNLISVQVLLFWQRFSGS